MSDSRRLVLVVSPSLLMLAGCKSMVAPRTGPPELNTFVPSSLRMICDSSNGNPDKDAPFIRGRRQHPHEGEDQGPRGS